MYSISLNNNLSLFQNASCWNRNFEGVSKGSGRIFLGHYEPKTDVAEVDQAQEHGDMHQAAET